MLFGEIGEIIWEPSGNNTKMGETSGETPAKQYGNMWNQLRT